MPCMRSLNKYKQSLIMLAFLCITLLQTGCTNLTGSGALQVESLGANPGLLPGQFSTAVYAENDNNVASFYLCDVPVEDLLRGKLKEGQIVHIELLWIPKPGRTPLDQSAANISVRHVIVTDGEFGVYGGAGFAIPDSKMGSTKVSVSIPEASLTLLESSTGFSDRLGPGRMSGTFTAVLDERLTRRIGLAASQLVTDMLGKPRYVKIDSQITSDTGS